MKDSTFKKYCLVIDEWFINGFNGTQAYKKFYPNATDETCASNFEKILRITEVSGYRNEKHLKAANKMQITLEDQLLELDDIKSLAKEEKKYADSISAIKEQNKLLAFYSEHNSQKATILTSDDRKSRIEELKSKIN